MLDGFSTDIFISLFFSSIFSPNDACRIVETCPFLVNNQLHAVYLSVLCKLLIYCFCNLLVSNISFKK